MLTAVVKNLPSLERGEGPPRAFRPDAEQEQTNKTGKGHSLLMVLNYCHFFLGLAVQLFVWFGFCLIVCSLFIYLFI